MWLRAHFNVQHLLKKEKKTDDSVLHIEWNQPITWIIRMDTTLTSFTRYMQFHVFHMCTCTNTRNMDC